MNKIILVIIFLLGIFVFSPVKKSFTQENNTLLVISHFQSREDLEKLFANSSRVLKYLEDDGIDYKVFLSLSTQIQYNNLKENNYSPEILDQNPEINRYVLLWSPYPNQAEKVSFAEKVFQISPHYILIKLLPNTTIEDIKASADFFPAPFSPTVVIPPTVIPKKTSTPFITAIISPPVDNKLSNNFLNIFLFGGVVIVIVVIIVGIVWYLKKKRNGDNTIPPPPSDIPPQPIV